MIAKTQKEPTKTDLPASTKPRHPGTPATLTRMALNARSPCGGKRLGTAGTGSQCHRLPAQEWLPALLLPPALTPGKKPRLRNPSTHGFQWHKWRNGGNGKTGSLPGARFHHCEMRRWGERRAGLVLTQGGWRLVPGEVSLHAVQTQPQTSKKCPKNSYLSPVQPGIGQTGPRFHLPERENIS